MDEQNTPNEEYIPHEEYTPRPWWQVWGARVALVVLIIGIACYYWLIAHPT